MYITPVLVVLNDQVKIFGKMLNVSINLNSAIVLSLKVFRKKSNFLHRLDAFFHKSLTSKKLDVLRISAKTESVICT